MNWIHRAGGLAVAFFALFGSEALAQTPATAFTYQGRLTSGGGPANGPHDLRFTLFDAATGGTRVGNPVCVDNVGVNDGLFTVQIDFGQQFATTFPRFLQIDVRADTGLNCAADTGFSTLSPRQQLTATPMASQANGAFALYPVGGSGFPAVVVDVAGKVGIGTLTPSKRLTVSGDMEVGINSSDYHFLRTGGGNSDGFLFGSFPRFGDGIHLSYNYLSDAFGVGSVIHPDGGTSRIGLHYGSLVFATGAAFTGEPAERARIDSAGNVGIGTAIPISKLDVRGDVRMGSSGQYLAAGGEENLRFVRGSCEAVGCTAINISAGTGFSVSVEDDGKFLVTFTTPFSGLPSVVVSSKPFACDTFATIANLSNSGFEVRVKVDSCSSGSCGSGFNFIAAGPR